MNKNKESGYAMLLVLGFVALLMSLIATYTALTRVEIDTVKSQSGSMKGFYAAEAGLNLRAEEIRNLFAGYALPTGTSPTTGTECDGSNVGAGDFLCKNYSIDKRSAETYVMEDAGNPVTLTIPVGERYQNLSAEEYRYTVISEGKNNKGDVEAILELRFKSRLVPLFQFASFYNKDLEIAPGPAMTLSGPVHVNGDLYLNTGNILNIDGQVTTSGALFRGGKSSNSCNGTATKQVRIKDPASYLALVPSCSQRVELATTDLTAWNGMIQRDVVPVDVPQPEALEATPGQRYWDKADLRLALKLDASNAPDTTDSVTGVEIRNPDNSVDTGATDKLDACVGSIAGKVVDSSYTFYHNREGKTMRLMEVDMQGLFNCVQTVMDSGSADQIFYAGRRLNDTTEGGLVIHLSVDGPDSNAASSGYGVRVRNGQTLQSTVAGADVVAGLTVVTDQSFLVKGDYNRFNKIPAAFLTDAFNILSNAWDLSDASSTLALNPHRVASETWVYAAVLSGTDSSGGGEGSGYQDGGGYNGGLENYPRFHERWSGKWLHYLGSFVSLNLPQRSNGAWAYGGMQYQAPKRDFQYDTDFNDPSLLPPLSPRFVYLKHELFLRDFEQ